MEVLETQILCAKSSDTTLHNESIATLPLNFGRKSRFHDSKARPGQSYSYRLIELGIVGSLWRSEPTIVQPPCLR